MTKEELKVILDNHKLWLEGKEGGVRADPGLADLYDANLKYANLYGADLEVTYLKGVNLMCAYLKSANLRDAIMPEGFKGETE